MTTQTATALAQAAEALTEGAAADKRAIASHRRSLRLRMQALDSVVKAAAEVGIRIEINTQPKGRQSGKDRDRT